MMTSDDFLEHQLEIAIAVAAIVVMVSQPASAQTDEIQVYTGALADVGVGNLTWHNNYTPKGQTTPAFPGAVIADKSFNGVTEWALGVTPWFEAGLYLPLYSRGKDSGWGIAASNYERCLRYRTPMTADSFTARISSSVSTLHGGTHLVFRPRCARSSVGT
ncbi:MAG: hypothetical protein ACRD3J_00415 [Thermoanaerobaculia bacterium]